MNTNALKARLTLIGKSVDDIVRDLDAKKGIKISRETFYRKLRGTSDFSRKEILALSELLDLTDSDTISIFFNDKVS